MRISQLLVESRIIPECRDPQKTKILQRIAETFARDLPGATSGEILERLLERENISSTGIGNGIAIPHGRISLTAPGGKWLSSPMAVLLRIESGVDFEALDGQPVYLIMALVSALENRDDHLHALSACSKLLRHAPTRSGLMSARDREAMFRVVMAGSEDFVP